MSLDRILRRLASRGVHSRRKKRVRPPRFWIESLERRTVLAIYTVTSTDPNFDGGDDDHLGLAVAISRANDHPNDSATEPDVIDFNISGSGVQTIVPASGLPLISDPVVIDGATQAANQGETFSTPLIELDGVDAGFSDGLAFDVGGNTVKGLIINNFGAFGIELTGINDPGHGQGPGPNNIIQADWIGTDSSGTTAAPNQLGGIKLSHSSHNLIGGVNENGELVEGNLISGNAQTGIFLADQFCTANFIEGNYIGTDVSGLKPIINGPAKVDGVFLGPPSAEPGAGFPAGNFIGDLDITGQVQPDGRNVIAGNSANGIYILGGANNLVSGNYIGVGEDGGTPIPNGEDGIRLEDASGNTIGGTADDAGNVISANQHNGIEILSDAQSEEGTPVQVSHQSATGNKIQGNMIGADVSGTISSITLPSGQKILLGNAQNGVVLRNLATDPSVVVSANLIGGDDASDGTLDQKVKARNVISGNLDNGILMEGALVTTNAVMGNRIGADLAGENRLANKNNGILLRAAAGQTAGPSGNTIGGATTGADNVISGNGQVGVFLANGSNSNSVLNNEIGADDQALLSLGNIDGVVIEDSTDNIIGGASTEDGNFISGNREHGVIIRGGDAQNNKVQRNRIGVGATGDDDQTTKLPNAVGVSIVSIKSGGATGNIVDRNIISANSEIGLEINDANDNQVTGNMIGSDETGTEDLGNGGTPDTGDGILVSAAAGNLIGGTTDAERNVIVFNQKNGIEISGSNAATNIVIGNYVGIGSDGVTKQGNHADGILIDGAPGTAIGGSAPQSAPNIISGNAGAGVHIQGQTAVSNAVAENFIGADAAGKQKVGNFDGVLISDGASFNSVVDALISGNNEDGIEIRNSANNSVRRNRIGTDKDGLAAVANQGNGISIINAPLTTVGGDDFVLDGNLIAGNGLAGIFVGDALTVGGRIAGNHIGFITTVDGEDVALGNGGVGVIISQKNSATGPSNIVVTGNSIGGNKTGGIALLGASDVHITNNSIGVGKNQPIPSEPAEPVDLPNVGFGIEVRGSSNNFIGEQGAGNTIAFTKADPSSSTALGYGVLVTGATSTENRIEANVISDNAADGVRIENGASRNSIGGLGGPSSRGNVIIRNLGSGIDITGDGTTHDDVFGNLIGIDKSGAAAGNKATGVVIEQGASNNTIGGGDKAAVEGSLNVISANLFGVFIGGDGKQAHDNTVSGNYIGADLTGNFQAGLGNSIGGVDIFNSIGNTIGGATSTPGEGPGNKIIGNALGVRISGDGNEVLGNVIANSQGGQTPEGIQIIGDGVAISGNINQIGGPDDADANSIHDNSNDGVEVQSGSGNSIRHNPIFANSKLGIELTPAGNGNHLQAAPEMALATTGNSHRLAGWLQAAPNKVYTIEFFVGQTNQNDDGSKNDDARRLIEPDIVTKTADARSIAPFKQVATNASGVAIFDVVLPDGLTDGDFITATATSPAGDTSQFSSTAAIVRTDSDDDGIGDGPESAHGGDPNNPAMVGVPDAISSNGFITLQASAGKIENAWSTIDPGPKAPSDPPNHTQFGLGFVAFTLTGITTADPITVTMTLPVLPSPGSVYWRYGKTTGTPYDHWYNWTWDGNPNHTGAEIRGDTITLHLIDGGRGDDDLTVNGEIVEPGSLGVPDPFTVTTTADSGPGSLRQAILNANANPGNDEITFRLPGPAPQTIQLLTPLPAITDPVTIDGFKLPPSEGTTDVDGASPLVVLDGSQAGPGTDGLTFEAGGCTVKGLFVDHFSGDGIRLESSGSLDPASFLGCTIVGMTLENNGGWGIEINDTPGNKIGAIQAGDGNVISNNAAGGVSIHGADARGNVVTGNFIGVAADGTTAQGNGGPGLEILAGAAATVEQNSIFANQGLGIDLNGDGVTPNDAGDGDGLQNFPMLSRAFSYGGFTYVDGTLASAPQTAITLDFYASAAADLSGFGQGQMFLGSALVSTDDSGQASFALSLEKSAPAGWFVTATATGSETSEFSAAVQLPVLQPNIYVVNTADDVDDVVPDPAHFSLREAIEAANAHPGQDTIDFNLPDQSRTIIPLSPLPDITDPVTIDGTSQLGFAGLPLVELDGSQAGAGADGLRISGGGSIVRGLAIHSFNGAGIELTGLGLNVVEGDFIGTDVAGAHALPNLRADVLINHSPDNLIGGTTAAARNVAVFVDVTGGNAGANGIDASAGGNRIEGNYIGVNATGTTLFAVEPNSQSGVSIDEASSNTIGGTAPGAGNVISNVKLRGENNVVQGNFIGVDSTGTALLGGSVNVIDYGDNLIGGTAAAARNIIAGTLSIESSHSNVIEGNYFGTDVTGTKPVGAAEIIDAGDHNTIGGIVPGAGNLIHGTLSLNGGANGGDLVEGNLIGVDVTGGKALGGGGIVVNESNAIIGGAEPGAGNVISGNDGNGITLIGWSGAVIRGNFIGADATGALPLGNGGDGIAITGGSQNDILGGASAGAANVIAANGGDGIRLADSPNSVEDAQGNPLISSGIVIQGNKIGADVSGTHRIGNAGDGISIVTAYFLPSDETIGGADPGAGNLVAYNGGRGIYVPFGQENAIRGNDVFANGDLGLVTDINGALSTYAEQRGLNVPHAAPVLASAVDDPQGTIISGSLTGTSFTRYDIDFFANDDINVTGYGDGQTYLQSISVLVDESGSARFQIPLDAAIPVGQWITATATPETPDGSTSMFSQPVLVVANPADSSLQFSAPTYLVTESGGAAVIVVTRTSSTTGAATVHYATSDGSAAAGTNYAANSGTLNFADGEASKSLTIPIADDGLATANKSFQITLSNATGASLGGVQSAAVTIADDDAAGQIQFAAAASVVDVGNVGSETVFQVVRTGGSQGRVTVDYRVSGGTAVQGYDYSVEGDFGQITFADGQTTAQIAIATDAQHIRDEVLSSDYQLETIAVTLGNPTGGATLGQNTSSTTTFNDDMLRTFTVTNSADSGPGSLRQAMLDSNSHPGIDTIDFDIADGSNNLILPQSPLPAITDPTIIDATTQPGYTGVPLVKVSGVLAGVDATGFAIESGQSTVKGLIIDGFDVGLQLDGGGNTIVGNWIGPDTTAGLNSGNRKDGVVIPAGSTGNRIGGDHPLDGNVISQNADAGVVVAGSNNTLWGNFVGTDATGLVALGNATGIVVAGANNQIGGPGAGQGNLISGNTGDGLEIVGQTATGNVIQGNVIGLDLGHGHAVGNGGAGLVLGEGASQNLVGGNDTGMGNLINNDAGIAIHIEGGASLNQILGNTITTSGIPNSDNNSGPAILIEDSSNNAIGDASPGAGNAIDSDKPGVAIVSGAGNAIRGNAINVSGALGIDLGDDFRTDNDPGDADTGANQLQNFPVVISATLAGGSVVIAGDLNSTPLTAFSIDLYTNFDSKLTGEVYLATIQVATDSAGHVHWTASVPTAALAGYYVTATAVDPAGNTSEFSDDYQLDVDGDGVFDSDEALAQNNGDANADGIPDRFQANVASIVDRISFVAPAGTQFRNVDVYDRGIPPGVPGRAQFPLGLFTWQLQGITPGAAVDVQLLVSDAFSFNAYYRFGPTPDQPSPHWDTFAFDGTTGAEISGRTITLHLVDGGRGDDDLAANDIIKELGGPTDGPETFLVTNTNDSGPGSLRQAILDSNAHPATDTIAFAIGSGPQTIAPLHLLPDINNPVIIDATTQPDYAGTPLITLSGASNEDVISSAFAEPFFNWAGITIRAGSSTVRGLAIGGFTLRSFAVAGTNDLYTTEGAGILVIAQGGNLIQDNTLDGNTYGIEIGNGSLTAQGGNVIAGNMIVLNTKDGVKIHNDCSNNRIGGTAPTDRNVISGNGFYGIEIGNRANNNVVEGNFIGVQADGITPFGNGSGGVELFEFGTTGNMIGGTGAGAGNIIAYNGAASVPNHTGFGFGVDLAGSIDTPLGNSILGNSIFNNFGLAITYGAFNVINDVPLVDADYHAGGTLLNVGSSNFELPSFPILSSASQVGGDTVIEGRIDAQPLETYRIELFSNSQFDPSAFGYPSDLGDGQTFLGAISVTTDATGNANFTATLPTLDPGEHFVTATTTAANGATSPFSARLAIGDALGSVFVVNTADDHDDGVADAADTTLREAIIAANNHPGLDVIHFNIGSGVQTINLNFDLPAIIDPVIIDASTQPGYQGSPLIVLKGTYDPSKSDFKGPAVYGLRLPAGGDTIRGLVIDGFTQAITDLGSGSGGDVIQGCFIGTDATGTRSTVSGDGIGLGGSNNLIGGTTPDARNVISGNRGAALTLSGSNNVVEGNFIGTDVTGTLRLPNGSGISIRGDHNTIGGTASGARNLISGNASDGLGISGSGNLVEGNYIGTDITGAHSLGNSGAGVRVGGAGNAGSFEVGSATIGGTTAAAGNLISGNFGPGVEFDGIAGGVVQGNLIGADITGTNPLANNSGIVAQVSDDVPAGFAPPQITVGGTTAGTGNAIAFNSGRGVNVLSGDHITILGNSIFSNGNLGIDLGGDGVTLNDSEDADTGPNALQNFPVIGQALSGAVTHLTAMLNSLPDTDFQVSFYTSDAADPSGFGEGRRYLATVPIHTDASGVATLALNLPASTNAGEFLTATATDPAGNNSEFSPAVQLAANTDAIETTTTLASDFSSGSTYGQTVTFTATVRADSGTPTGSVDFVDQTTGQDLGAAALTVINGVGQASVRVTRLSAGSHAFIAAYTSASSDFVDSLDSFMQTVVPATLTVTADNKSKIYGADNPLLTDTITGFVNGDSPSVVAGVASLSTTATSTSGVGNYAITVGTGTLNAANYAFAVESGTLSVTPATLTVNADDKTMVVGATVPSLTDTIAGFVNGDTANAVLGAATLSTTATSTSPVGSYPIIVGPGTLNAANYTFAFVNGTMSITPTDGGSGEGGIAAAAEPVEGYEFSSLTTVPVATFTDTSSVLLASDFGATIDWGDGTTSAGSISLASGVFTVRGSHEYLDEGHYTIRTDIEQTAGPPTGVTQATVSATAVIHEELLSEGMVGTPNQNYIQEIYRDLFGRQAEPAGREFWADQIAQGLSRNQLAREMVTLALPEEFQHNTVSQLYQQYLGRNPDAAGKAFWTAYLFDGGTIEGMSQELVGSVEYFQRRGGDTTNGFLTSLFRDAFGRDIDPAGLSYFQALMTGGVSAKDVAAIVFASTEYHRFHVDALFEQFMDRAADRPALVYFARQLDASATEESVIVQLIASEEYFAKAQL